MSLSPSAQRTVLLVLTLTCVIVIAWQAGHLIVRARTAELDAAERAITQAAAPLIASDRVPERLIQVVQSLIDKGTADLDFLTIRNANNAILVSRGRLGAHGLAWLSFGDGRALRGWAYRLRAAQVVRPIEQGGQRVGFAHYGVSWTGVVYRAGLPLFVWATALLAGIIGLFGVLVRRSAPAVPAADVARSAPETPAANGPPQAQKRASLSRFLVRKPASASGFEPIGAASGLRRSHTDTTASREPPRTAVVSEPHPSARGAPVDQPAGESPHAKTSHKPKEPEQPEKPIQAGPPDSLVPPLRSPEKNDPPAPAPPAERFEAPQMQARSVLGDTTLDLRFYPIWRGAPSERVLAGACAALAWRSGAAELVDADTLTSLAEQDGALRAFTQWIARRFSLLHGNWRTLELNTVPIVLPIPSAMLAFADAEAVWRHALRRTDRDPNDLILRLDSPTVASAQASLPLRHARRAPDDHAHALPEDCDVLCVSPQQVGGDAAAWRARFDGLDCPVLFGPVTQPDDPSDIIGHERVLWFSEQPETIHSPRSFARLLARNPTAPI